ncbi:acyl-CoA dehydrogenase family protein [Psychrobacillus sp. NPDC096426]|uniref:acyl-CoA dehydrogenase family protein n=1 Tax=Psychrobacillus sp. NPDC096426 TaxID=3364491 RepID=UPI0038278033
MTQLTYALTHEEVVEIAKTLALKVKPRFNLTEELSRQPQENIQDFIDSGLVRTMTPKHWGGYELGFDTLYETVKEISKADPSAGWCYSLLLIHSWMLAYFPEEVQREVWENDIDALIASSFNPAPMNKVISVEGGYQLNGQWGFSSGIDHSDWVMVMGFVDLNPDTGAPSEVLMMMVPKEDIVVQNTWKTVATKGTGSNNILLENVFVPKHRTLDMIAWCQRGEGPGRRINTSLLYSYPLFAAMPVSLSSSLIGASIGAYEQWRETMRSKVNKSNEKVADFTHQQIRIAEVSATITAAEALLEKTIIRLTTGETIDIYEKLVNRRNYGYVARLCNQAVKAIVDNAGASMIYESNPLQRYWRDVQASSLHYAFNLDMLGELFGKMELGIELNPKSILIV